MKVLAKEVTLRHGNQNNTGDIVLTQWPGYGEVILYQEDSNEPIGLRLNVDLRFEGYEHGENEVFIRADSDTAGITEQLEKLRLATIVGKYSWGRNGATAHLVRLQLPKSN